MISNINDEFSCFPLSFGVICRGFYAYEDDAWSEDDEGERHHVLLEFGFAEFKRKQEGEFYVW